MAKHAKKNNIISYDEAKQKKIKEKEERNQIDAKHFKDVPNDFDDFQDDGYNYNAPKRAKYGKYAKEPEQDYNNYQEFKDYQEQQVYEDEYSEYDEQNEYDDDVNGRDSFERRNPRYEVKRERLPSNLVNFIIVTAMVAFLIFLTVMLYRQYVVETIIVTGNDEVTYYEIMEQCGVEYKQSMMKVKAEDVIENFERNQPMIEVLEVKKIWPNTIELIVKERTPVCYIVLKGSQKCALIGEDNVCLGIQDSYLEGDMPRIFGLDVGTGELGKELSDGETRKLEVLKEIIDAMTETNCIAELESININNITNIIMMSTSGTEIKIGDASNLVAKFKVAKIGIKRLISENNTDVTMVITGDNTFDIE